jgi:hypothetical protein
LWKSEELENIFLITLILQSSQTTRMNTWSTFTGETISCSTHPNPPTLHKFSRFPNTPHRSQGCQLSETQTEPPHWGQKFITCRSRRSERRKNRTHILIKIFISEWISKAQVFSGAMQ